MDAQKEALNGVDRPRLLEAVFVMLFAAIMFVVSFTFDRVPAILAQGIQPTAFPRGILFIMFMLAAIQVVKSSRVSRENLRRLKPIKSVPPIVFLTAGLLIGFFLIMPVIGTFLSIAIFLPALAILWCERRWLLMALSFAGFMGFVFVLFRLVMNVPLP